MDKLTDLVIQIKDYLFSMLNPDVISTDSFEGWVVIIATVLLIYNITKNAGDFIGWCLGVILVFQMGHLLSLTPFNNIIPFDVFFKYDVLQAVAQCFVGTKFCNVLLFIDAILRSVCVQLWDIFKSINIHDWKETFNNIMEMIR